MRLVGISTVATQGEIGHFANALLFAPQVAFDTFIWSV